MQMTTVLGDEEPHQTAFDTHLQKYQVRLVKAGIRWNASGCGQGSEALLVDVLLRFIKTQSEDHV
jgi:hypothetical protein